MSKASDYNYLTSLSLLDEVLSYLESKFNNHCAYLWGGSGQIVGKTTVDEIKKAESTSSSKSADVIENIKKVLDFIGKMIEKGYDLNKSQYFDCSGLIIDALNHFKLFIGDATANTLYDLGRSINIKNAKRGDLVFKGTDKKKDHVGMVITKNTVIECKGRAYGVVISDISEWKYAARYTWFEDLKLKRKLKIQKPALEGPDVTDLQLALCSHGISCSVTGTFTENTKQAVTRFQKASGLTVISYGTVAKKTAQALGFKWIK